MRILFSALCIMSTAKYDKDIQGTFFANEFFNVVAGLFCIIL